METSDVVNIFLLLFAVTMFTYLISLKIKNNNLILAIPSSGLHSNGYSLVRYLLKQKKNRYQKK